MPIALRLLVPLRQWLMLFGSLAAFLILKMGVRPLLKAASTPQGGIVSEVTGAVPRAVASGLLWIERQVESALSHFAAAGLPVGAGWLSSQAVLARETYKEFNALAQDTLEAFGILRRQTLPRVAKAAAAPALNRAKAAQKQANRSISLGKTMNVRLGRSISANTKRLGALAAIVLGIDVLVKGRHAARHHRDHASTIPGLRAGAKTIGARVGAQGRTLGRHGTRLGKLEKLLAGGALLAWLLRVMAKRWPFMFCRQWLAFSKAICGMRPGAFASLFGLLFSAWALSDLRRSARLAQDALGFVTGTTWDAASIGDRPSGRFTVD